MTTKRIGTEKLTYVSKRKMLVGDASELGFLETDYIRVKSHVTGTTSRFGWERRVGNGDDSTLFVEYGPLTNQPGRDAQVKLRIYND